MEENQERRKRQKQEKGTKNDTDEVHNEGSHEGIDVKKKGKEKQSESKGEGMRFKHYFFISNKFFILPFNAG